MLLSLGNLASAFAASSSTLPRPLVCRLIYSCLELLLRQVRHQDDDDEMCDVVVMVEERGRIFDLRLMMLSQKLVRKQSVGVAPCAK